jgi:hypothetical protein
VVVSSNPRRRITPGSVKPLQVTLVEPVAYPSALVIDHSGVGRPVYDLFSAARLKAPIVGITISGGNTVTRDGLQVRVPKRDLVAVVSVLLQNHQLDIVSTLPDAETLTQELLSFRVKQDPLTGHDSYGEWRTGHHDDLVLSVALALWYAEHGGMPAQLSEVVGL